MFVCTVHDVLANYQSCCAKTMVFQQVTVISCLQFTCEVRGTWVHAGRNKYATSLNAYVELGGLYECEGEEEEEEEAFPPLFSVSFLSLSESFSLRCFTLRLSLSALFCSVSSSPWRFDC